VWIQRVEECGVDSEGGGSNPPIDPSKLSLKMFKDLIFI